MQSNCKNSASKIPGDDHTVHTSATNTATTRDQSGETERARPRHSHSTFVVPARLRHRRTRPQTQNQQRCDGTRLGGMLTRRRARQPGHRLSVYRSELVATRANRGDGWSLGRTGGRTGEGEGGEEKGELEMEEHVKSGRGGGKRRGLGSGFRDRMIAEDNRAQGEVCCFGAWRLTWLGLVRPRSSRGKSGSSPMI